MLEVLGYKQHRNRLNAVRSSRFAVVFEMLTLGAAAMGLATGAVAGVALTTGAGATAAT